MKAKPYLIFFLFLYSFIFSLKAQSPFTTLLPFIDDQSIADIAFFDEHIYVLEWIYETPDLTKGHNRISVLDIDGKVVAQRFPKRDNDRLFYNFSIFNEQLLLLGNEKNLTEQQSLAIYGINSDAVINRIMLIPLGPYRMIDMTKPQLINKGNELILSSLHQRAALRYQMSFIKINKRYGLLQHKVYDPDHSCKAYSFVKADSGYLLSAILWPEYNFSIQISKLDEEFNLTQSLDLDDQGISAPSSLRYLYNGKFIFAAQHEPLRDMALMLRKSDLELQNMGYFGKPGDTNDRPASVRCVDLTSDRKIIAGSTSNHNGNIYSDNNSWIHLVKFNTFPDDIEWEHFYGGDAFYTLNIIEPLDDGNILMAGTHYATGSGTYKRNNIIMRVNPEGVITSIGEQNIIQVGEIQVFPNPGQDIIHWTLNNDKEIKLLEISDLNNRLVYSTQNPVKQINTSRIQSGSYILRLLDIDGNVHQTRWIKQ